MSIPIFKPEENLIYSIAQGSSLLNPLVKSWLSMIQKYIEAMEGYDCPWWYNERALVGLLSAAAWNAGGISLEEYPTAKNKEGDTCKGRCDLYVHLNKIEMIFEAKMLRFMSLGDKQDSKSQLLKTLRAAANCVSEHPKKTGHHMIAVAFLVPELPTAEGFSQNLILEKCMELIRIGDEMAHEHTCAFAGYFQTNFDRPLEGQGYISPGVMTFFQHCK